MGWMGVFFLFFTGWYRRLRSAALDLVVPLCVVCASVGRVSSRTRSYVLWVLAAVLRTMCLPLS